MGVLARTGADLYPVAIYVFLGVKLRRTETHGKGESENTAPPSGTARMARTVRMKHIRNSQGNKNHIE